MIRITTNILGTFALRDDKIIEKILFPRNAEEIGRRLEIIEDSLCKEERDIIKKLRRSGIKTIYVRDPERFEKENLEIEFLLDKEPINPIDIAQEIGVSKEEFIDLMSEANLELTKRKLKGIGRDQILIQAVGSIDDLDETINRLIKRLREWYSLRFPELDYMVKKHETYAAILSKKTEDLDEGLLRRIDTARRKSIGIKFSERDEEVIRRLSNSILELYSTRHEIEDYIEKLMAEVAPNISALAGPMLGARLISLAGGLERLSLFPASTIQVLGAEDAFFRFLKTKKRPPKHGVIFQLPEIRSAPKDIRGRISRTFAAKLAIAARTDYFKGKFIGDRLRMEFLDKIKDMNI